MKRLADLLRDPQFRADVGNNARDFLQSASNTAASNVTAPVDGLAWLLRKAGVPVPQAPVGGSDWAQNAGLMAEPKNKTSLASLLGEAAGNIAPIAGYAKAPEIAGGINQMIRNANAPTPFNNAKKGQLGAVVWHGSPHKFDAFDASKIGTGEGAQAYGHGLYLAENPGVAESYKRAGETAAPIQFQGEGIMNWALGNRDKVKAMPSVSQKALAYVRDFDSVAQARQMAKMNDMNDVVSEIDRLNKLGSLVDGPQGNFYKVDLPDEHIAKMLDWDKPLSQQPHILDGLRNSNQEWAARFVQDLEHNTRFTGKNLVENASAASESKAIGASDYFRQAGIPGIRYLDGGSRGAGQGSSNFVVFPGNESLLKILSRNGQNLP